MPQTACEIGSVSPTTGSSGSGSSSGSKVVSGTISTSTSSTGVGSGSDAGEPLSALGFSIGSSITSSGSVAVSSMLAGDSPGATSSALLEVAGSGSRVLSPPTFDTSSLLSSAGTTVSTVVG